MSSRSVSRRISQAGFTLLELLIAISLLTVISFAIYQATTETYRVRDILLNEGDFYNGIRLSMGVMERDIAAIYTPLMMKPDEKKSPQQPNLPPPPPDANDMSQIMSTQPSEFWGTAVDRTRIRPSRFVGTSNKMSFISTSNVRIYKDSPESDFQKVIYEMQEDRSEDKLEGTSVLTKIASPNAFETEKDEKSDKMRKTYPLLAGVKKIRFRYYRKEKDRWEDRWDSDHPDYKDTYPDMIEVTIEVVGPSRLRFEGVYKMKPEVPLRGINPST